MILACVKESMGRAYTGEHIYKCSSSQVALWALDALRVTSKFVWECQQALCALSRWKKFLLPLVPGHCGVQDKEEANTLAREESGSPFLSSKPAILISPCVDRLKTKSC
jgi:hypothetical protein